MEFKRGKPLIEDVYRVLNRGGQFKFPARG
jgi:hypothetical protein